MKILRLCECGCGGSIRPRGYGSRRPDGTYAMRDSGARFLRGHHLRVAPPPWWKGDAVGYRSLHTYLNAHYPKAGRCEECGAEGKTDYALRSGREHSRDRSDYRELCRRCHVAYDGVMERLNARRTEVA